VYQQQQQQQIGMITTVTMIGVILGDVLFAIERYDTS
jgi:hypothetical protein